ncbi:MAG: SufD family Fe-S cluster assembly protein [Bacteroidales bacterium]|nr:SufD family Fe-S cluster assembly protein [Bacteroidales bacterium]
MDKVFVIRNGAADGLPSRIVLEAGEKLKLTLVVMPGVSCERSVRVELNGPGAEADIAGLCLCEGKDRVSLELNLEHNSGGCTSRQLFKSLADDAAKVSFSGLVKVAAGAQKTKALQESHALLLSPDASVQSQPQLEIYADDVECSHGATTGYLNPDEQFYLRSRGVPEAEARRLQLISFISPVLQRLPEDLAAELSEAL